MVANYALGIGVALAVFAVVDRVLFRELPFGAPAQLVSIQPYDPISRQVYFTLSRTLVVELRKEATVFDDIAFAGNTRPYFLDGPDAPPIQLTEASYNLLDVVGVPVVEGRSFTRPDALMKSRLVIVREEAWRSRYGSSREVIGRTFRDSRGPVEVIGVVPSGFVVPTVNWATRSDGLILSAELLESTQSTGGVPASVARLRAGASIEMAQNALAHVAGVLEPDPARRASVVVRPLRYGLYWNSFMPMAVVMCGALVVWIGAVANLTTLVSAHVWTRRAELAVRVALGESRDMLLRSLALETLTVCLLGTVSALLLLYWSLGALAASIPGFIQPLVLTSLDSRMVGLAIGACLVASGVVVLVQSRVVRQVPAVAVLLQGTAASPNRRWIGGRALLVIQGAVAMGLLVSGASTVWSFAALTSTPLGFDPNNLYTLGIANTTRSGGQEFSEMLSRLGKVPGVREVSAVDVPIAQGETPETVSATSVPDHKFARRRVHANYFDVMRVGFLSGRPFTEGEREREADVVVLSVAAAGALWPGASATEVLYRSVRLTGDSERIVVGVIEDQRDRQGVPPRSEVYVPATVANPASRAIIRAESEISAAGVRDAVRTVYGAQTRVVVGTVSAALEPWLANPTLYSLAFGGFGVVGVLVALAGVSSIAVYELRRRRTELAIRMAVGSTRQGVVTLFLRDMGCSLGVGTLIGGAVAWFLASLLEPLLHGVSAREPTTFVLAGVGLLTAGAVLIGFLVMRSSSLDPSALLRQR